MHPLETAGRPAFPFVITVSRIYGGPRDTVLKLSGLFHEAVPLTDHLPSRFQGRLGMSGRSR